MSNRDDFDNVAAEVLLRTDLAAQIEIELHNAFVAGQEAEDANLRAECDRLRLELKKLGDAIDHAVKSGRKHHTDDPSDAPDLHFFLDMLNDLAAATTGTR